MLSTNKAIAAGLLGGAVVWSGSHYLPWGFEGGLLCGWAAVLPDIDSAYEYATKHVEHAPAVLAVPFGRLLGDHLHSKYRVKFLHSFMGLAFFYLVARSASLLPFTSYAIFWLIIAFWATFSLERYCFHSFLRFFRRKRPSSFIIYVPAGIAGILVAISVPRIMTPGLFALAIVLGVATNILMEFFSARGAPLFWPLPRYFKLPVIGETGGPRETVFVWLFLFAWFAWWTNHYSQWHPLWLPLIEQWHHLL